MEGGPPCPPRSPRPLLATRYSLLATSKLAPKAKPKKKITVAGSDDTQLSLL